MKARFSLWALKCLVFIFRLIPFWFIYRLSDCLTWINFHIVKARSQVIQRNLNFLLPHLSDDRKRHIEKETMRNFFDVMLETIKSFTMSKMTFNKRFKVINADNLQNFYQQSKSVVCFTSHTGNWEWASSIQFTTPHQYCFVFKRLHNRLIDDYVLKNRSQFGAILCHPKQMTRTLVKQRHTPTLYGLIADQRPGGGQGQVSVIFFNREISCYKGPELIAKKFDYPVIFGDIRRIKRGYYEVKTRLITDRPRDTADGEISQRCFDHLASAIERDPSSWMWLQRRFKGIINYR